MVADLEARHYLVQSGIEKIIDRNLHSLNTVIGTSTFGNLKPVSSSLCRTITYSDYRKNRHKRGIHVGGATQE
jgi:hypothetical protein